MYYFYVAVFGAVGASLRYGISLAMNHGGFPFGTLLVNVAGCFLLAYIVQSFATSLKLSSAFVNGLGTGLIGSFTTFSTFSVEVLGMIQQEAYLSAFLYVLTSLVAGFFAAGMGFAAAGSGLSEAKRQQKAGGGHEY